MDGGLTFAPFLQTPLHDLCLLMLVWMQPHRASIGARADKIDAERPGFHLPIVGIFLWKHFGVEACNWCTEDLAGLWVIC